METEIEIGFFDIIPRDFYALLTARQIEHEMIIEVDRYGNISAEFFITLTLPRQPSPQFTWAPMDLSIVQYVKRVIGEGAAASAA